MYYFFDNILSTFFFSGSLSRTSMICLLEQSCNILFFFPFLFSYSAFLFYSLRDALNFSFPRASSCFLTALFFLLEECINYVSEDIVDFLKFFSAVCIISFIWVSFFHLLVLILKSFYYCLGQCQDYREANRTPRGQHLGRCSRLRPMQVQGQLERVGTSLASLSSQLWTLMLGHDPDLGMRC